MADFKYWNEVFLALFTQAAPQSNFLAAWLPTIREGFKLYQIVQVFPGWLQAAFIFGFLNLVLVLYDVHVARAAMRGDQGLNQRNVLPVRHLLQRAIVLSATLFLVSLHGVIALLTAFYFYVLLTCRYFYSGALVLILLILHTIFYQLELF